MRAGAGVLVRWENARFGESRLSCIYGFSILHQPPSSLCKSNSVLCNMPEA